MARRQVVYVTSDLTGAEVEEQQAVRLIIRRGPGVERPVVIDALPSELGDLAEAPDIFMVEVKPYDAMQPPREMLVNLKELKKVAPNGDIDQLLEGADSLRGRPRGSTNRA